MYLCYTGTCACRTQGPAHTYVFCPVRPSIHPSMHASTGIHTIPSFHQSNTCMYGMHIHIHAHMHLRRRALRLACTHARTQARKHASTHTRTQACKHASSKHARTPTLAGPPAHAHTHAGTHGSSHPCTHTDSHTVSEPGFPIDVAVAFEGWSLDAHAVSLSWEP